MYDMLYYSDVSETPCMGVSARFAAAYYGCTQLPQGFGQVDLASTVAELRRHAKISYFEIKYL